MSVESSFSQVILYFTSQFIILEQIIHVYIELIDSDIAQ